MWTSAADELRTFVKKWNETTNAVGNTIRDKEQALVISFEDNNTSCIGTCGIEPNQSAFIKKAFNLLMDENKDLN